MRLVTCRLQEIEEWFEQNIDLADDQQSEFDFGFGIRAKIGPNGNAIVFRNSGRGPFAVKLLKGSSQDGYDHFGKQVDSTRPAFGRSDMTTYRLFSRAPKKLGAFWLVIDDN